MSLPMLHSENRSIKRALLYFPPWKQIQHTFFLSSNDDRWGIHCFYKDSPSGCDYDPITFYLCRYLDLLKNFPSLSHKFFFSDQKFFSFNLWNMLNSHLNFKNKFTLLESKSLFKCLLITILTFRTIKWVSTCCMNFILPLNWLWFLIFHRQCSYRNSNNLHIAKCNEYFSSLKMIAMIYFMC